MPKSSGVGVVRRVKRESNEEVPEHCRTHCNGGNPDSHKEDDKHPYKPYWCMVVRCPHTGKCASATRDHVPMGRSSVSF